MTNALIALTVVHVGCVTPPETTRETPRVAAPATAATALETVAPVKGCTEPAVGAAGSRRLALLVGVGNYKNRGIPTLLAPVNDVAHVRQVLKDRFEFPDENVCVLTDAAATVGAFREMFLKSLVDRAEPGDVTLVYFSGHGSQQPDVSNPPDEGDGQDETWVLYDSRTPGMDDLVDDEVDGLIHKLSAKTSNVTVILDSCNSGSAAKAVFEINKTVKGIPSAKATGNVGVPLGTDHETPLELLPNLVLLTAAKDGTSAIEIDGHSLFTEALLAVFSEAGDSPLLYSQVRQLVPPRVPPPQITSYQGQLTREVLGTRVFSRPLGWEIKELGPPIKLIGPPSPWMGVGSELRIYPPTLRGTAYQDPEQAKATVVVREMHGVTALATIRETNAKASKPELGDLAIPFKVADAKLKIAVGIRPATQAGGLPKARADQVVAAIQKDPDAARLVEVRSTKLDFELSVIGDGSWGLIDSEGFTSNRFDSGPTGPAAVAAGLVRHARVKALKQLHGEPGKALKDEETLRVELVPAPSTEQAACGTPHVKDWVPAGPGEEQVVPLCVAFHVRVTLAATAAAGLRVGGVLLSRDGSITGFGDGSAALAPGDHFDFPLILRGCLPENITEQVRVFGTRLDSPINFTQLTSDTPTLAKGLKSTSLRRALGQYLIPGAKGPIAAEGEAVVIEDSAWTLSTLKVRTQVNKPLTAVAADAASPDGGPRLVKELSLSGFDVRPYLPDDADAGVSKVLAQADKLARLNVGYQQHFGWDDSRISDEKNLAVGIDCSRAVWFAFTRAGLPYSKGNKYHPTEALVGPTSPLAENFEPCNGARASMLGDLLVYRDDAKGDGHVVMVIDPALRVGWGSHGYDSKASKTRDADLGVEYQLIKNRDDWRVWDGARMELKACWRHKQFAREAAAGNGLPGLKALGENPCAPKCARR